MHLWLLQGKWARGSELSNTGPRESLPLLLLLLFICHLKVLHLKCLNVMSYLFGLLSFLSYMKYPSLSSALAICSRCFTITHTSELNQLVCTTQFIILNTASLPHPVNFCDSAQQPLFHKCLSLCSVLPPTATLSYNSWKFSYSITSDEQPPKSCIAMMHGFIFKLQLRNRIWKVTQYCLHGNLSPLSLCSLISSAWTPLTVRCWSKNVLPVNKQLF